MDYLRKLFKNGYYKIRLAMKKIVYLFLLVQMQLWSQNVIFYNNDSINKMDSNKHKTGFWKLYDLKRGITVSGEVKNNQKFKEVDYFINGKPFVSHKQDSILIFYIDGKRIKTKLSKRKQGIPIVKENGEPIDDEIKDKYFEITELTPMFYGGEKAISDYISKNVNKNLIQRSAGRVVVEFVINIDGMTEGFMIVNSENPVLNQEAIRLIKNMPRWQPGFQQGSFVRTVYRLPINF